MTVAADIQRIQLLGREQQQGLHRNERRTVSFARVTGLTGWNNVAERVASPFAEGHDVVLGEPLHVAATIDTAMVVVGFNRCPLSCG